MLLLSSEIDQSFNFKLERLELKLYLLTRKEKLRAWNKRRSLCQIHKFVRFDCQKNNFWVPSLPKKEKVFKTKQLVQRKATISPLPRTNISSAGRAVDPWMSPRAVGACSNKRQPPIPWPGHPSSKDMPVSGRITFLRQGKIEAEPLENSRGGCWKVCVLKLIMKKILETIERSYDTHIELLKRESNRENHPPPPPPPPPRPSSPFGTARFKVSSL